MKIVIAPNAFKGSLTATKAAQAIERGIIASGLDCITIIAPIADGGDGTMEVLIGPKGARQKVEVTDPLGRIITAEYGVMADDTTAVIEMAKASGLNLIEPSKYNPLITTTYGTGQLIKAAVEAGYKRIILGVGGSATVDGGVGCLQALGIGFLDYSRLQVGFGGGQLDRIVSFDSQTMLKDLANVEILVACDVDNPLIGPNGAAAVFGPQKGASPTMVTILDDNLIHLFSLVANEYGDVKSMPRGGSAGGLAAGLYAFCNARLMSGADLVLDSLGLDELIATADLVITGEGRLDTQTRDGKGPAAIGLLSKKHGIKAVALAGSVDSDVSNWNEIGLDAAVSIADRSMEMNFAMVNAAKLLEAAAKRLGNDLLIHQRKS